MPTTRKRMRVGARQPPVFTGYVRSMHAGGTGTHQPLFDALLKDDDTWCRTRDIPDAKHKVAFLLFAMQELHSMLVRVRLVSTACFWAVDHPTDFDTWKKAFYDEDKKGSAVRPESTPSVMHILNVLHREFDIDTAQFAADSILALVNTVIGVTEEEEIDLQCESGEDRLFRDVSLGPLIQMSADADDVIDEDDGGHPLSIAGALEEVDRLCMTCIIAAMPAAYYSLVGNTDGQQTCTPEVSDFFNKLSGVLDIETRRCGGADTDSDSASEKGEKDADGGQNDTVDADSDIASIASSNADMAPVEYVSCCLPRPEVFDVDDLRAATDEELARIAYADNSIVLCSSIG